MPALMTELRTGSVRNQLVPVTPELRAYLAHRLMRMGHWAYSLPDGSQVDSDKPAMHIPLREVFTHVQISLRPQDEGWIVTALWQGMYSFQGGRYSVSSTYGETLSDDFNLTDALAKEALNACHI